MPRIKYEVEPVGKFTDRVSGDLFRVLLIGVIRRRKWAPVHGLFAIGALDRARGLPHILYTIILMQGLAERMRTFDQTPWAMHMAPLNRCPTDSGQ
ncbi:MAG: hypothetical protein GKC03_04360 [Methanomassiliicoccales archaeon]|nr:hypothetical protein [Methanomassiliicoccales archaeon]NYT16001.1 hypothetical protein [Methanomassiliicoccales archaeon]